MNQTIIESIQRKQKLAFTYNGKTRIVEPQCYGMGHKGTELLRAHQLKGGVQRSRYLMSRR
jgi:hypothetical protein